METEAAPGWPRGVAMETSPGLGLGSLSSPQAQNPAEPLCEAGAAVAAARWDLRKHSLLIVIGDIGTESQLRAVRAHLEQGILSWNIDLSSFDLNQELRLFITRHLAHFSTEVKDLDIVMVTCLYPWRIVKNFLEKPTWLRTAAAPPLLAPLSAVPTNNSQP